MKKARCSTKSVGIILQKNKKVLLLDRAFFPFGWACPAGHLRRGEKPVDGIRRELKEETNLQVIKPKLILFKKHVPNKCVKGSVYHDWYVFEGKARGKIIRNKSEAKDIGWFLPEEIKKMKLEPIWRLWLKTLKII